ncbi:MAG: phosphatidylglycerol lysyltransferase domain-containing protein [Prevotella sp.]|nr:phosphatidylglycerol lysyltransferase domain-containing protein [Prevotella sp.]
MLDFKVIELSDRPWINELLKKSDFRGCEYNFSNNFAWHRLYSTTVCRYKDFYISRSMKYGMRFTFPAGSGDYKDLFLTLKREAEAAGCPLVISSVTDENLGIFEELFGGRFSVSCDEADSDYIYDAEKLRTLSGKKYHQKRNHLARFYENNWEYSPMEEKDFDECIEFAVNSYNLNQSYDDESSVAEQYAINTFMNYFGELELKGGVIRVDGKVQGFTIGDAINSDAFDIHIEKANAGIQGAYAAINNEFAKSAANGYTYINREEDLGLEGLRKSKRSYHPVFMLRKNVVTFK